MTIVQTHGPRHEIIMSMAAKSALVGAAYDVALGSSCGAAVGVTYDSRPYRLLKIVQESMVARRIAPRVSIFETGEGTLLQLVLSTGLLLHETRVRLADLMPAVEREDLLSCVQMRTVTTCVCASTVDTQLFRTWWSIKKEACLSIASWRESRDLSDRVVRYTVREISDMPFEF